MSAVNGYRTTFRRILLRFDSDAWLLAGETTSAVEAFELARPSLRERQQPRRRLCAERLMTTWSCNAAFAPKAKS